MEGICQKFCKIYYPKFMIPYPVKYMPYTSRGFLNSYNNVLQPVKKKFQNFGPEPFDKKFNSKY